MLLLFAFSIAPKQLLHDAITGHKHQYIKYDGDINIHSSNSSFQCNWSNDAIESPFANQPAFHLDHPAITYSSQFSIYILSFYSTHHFFSSLRGPPRLA
jgi:hypothetical protein